MLDLGKFNTQIDLKNIDPDELAKILVQHQYSMIKLVLVVGSFIILGAMFNDHRIKDQQLRAKMSQMQEKLQVINSSDVSNKDFDKFKSSLPKKLNENDLITLISDYARTNNIAITSLSPAESKDMGLYDVINVNFDAASDNFKNMILFLRKLERSDIPLMVNAWTGHEETDGRITFSIEISNVNIHT